MIYTREKLKNIYFKNKKYVYTNNIGINSFNIYWKKINSELFLYRPNLYDLSLEINRNNGKEYLYSYRFDFNKNKYLKECVVPIDNMRDIFEIDKNIWILLTIYDDRPLKESYNLYTINNLSKDKVNKIIMDISL